MRILLVSDLYAPVIGGLEHFVEVLAHELGRRGHHVAVATLRTDASPAYEETEDGVHLYRISGWSRALAPFYERADRKHHPPVADPGVVKALRELFNDERPQVVHAQGWIIYSVLAARRGRRPRVILGLHDYGLVCVKKTFVHAGAVCSGPAYAKCVRCATGQYGAAKSFGLTSGLFLSGHRHRRVDRFVANSRAVAEASRTGSFGAHGAIDVIPGLVEDGAAERAVEAPRPTFLPEEDDFILFVGALGAHKGLHVLLEAYAGLPHSVPLVLLGTQREDTPERYLPGVRVAIDVPHDQVMAAFARCALTVVPSVWPEPFGQVAVEAMACGRAVVASDVGGLREVVVHGDTGLLVPAADPATLCDALSALISDPERRHRMGEAGRRRARRFRVSRIADELEGIYAWHSTPEGSARA